MHVLGAFAEFERALASDRTRQSLAGRPRGRQGGRPRVLTGRRLNRAHELMGAGEMTMSEVASVVGCSVSTLQRAIRAAKVAG